jgi:hypothetical protein
MTTVIALVVATAVLGCSAGCDFVMPGSVHEVDPKLVREARDASPECKHPAWMLEKKETYAKEELEQQSAAATACNKAVARYLDEKHKGRY